MGDGASNLTLTQFFPFLQRHIIRATSFLSFGNKKIKLIFLSMASFSGAVCPVGLFPPAKINMFPFWFNSPKCSHHFFMGVLSKCLTKQSKFKRGPRYYKNTPDASWQALYLHASLIVVFFNVSRYPP